MVIPVGFDPPVAASEKATLIHLIAEVVTPLNCIVYETLEVEGLESDRVINPPVRVAELMVVGK